MVESLLDRAAIANSSGCQLAPRVEVGEHRGVCSGPKDSPSTLTGLSGDIERFTIVPPDRCH
jgi:hypothetical protein